MLLDTHCHLDASEFDNDRSEVLDRAIKAKVNGIIIPAVSIHNFDTVRSCAHSFSGGMYALGIHPICVPQAKESDLNILEQHIVACLNDNRFVAIGEIGLDYFIPELKTPAMRTQQEFFYTAQLKLAQKYSLPVLLHVRRSQDIILKHLRKSKGVVGIAHAFNGSFQQAQHFIDQGFLLGAGGAMTFERALQIRRLVSDISLEHWVLETDAPDIPPAWLYASKETRPRNEPAEVAQIAKHMAALKHTDRQTIISATYNNAKRVLTRISI